jgi:hypothetical protein
MRRNSNYRLSSRVESQQLIDPAKKIALIDDTLTALQRDLLRLEASVMTERQQKKFLRLEDLAARFRVDYLNAAMGILSEIAEEFEP